MIISSAFSNTLQSFKNNYMQIKKNKNFFINLDDALLNNFKFVVILRFDNGQLLNSN